MSSATREVGWELLDNLVAIINPECLDHQLVMCNRPQKGPISYRRLHGELVACRVMRLLLNRSFTTAAGVVLALSLSLSCQSKLDRAGAKAVSDSFMSDLVASKLDDALAKMEPAFVQAAGGHDKAVGAIQKVFDYCGRPLNGTYWRDEVGFYAYLDGRKKPMRKFYYTTPTTQRPEGGCYFTVMVVPGDQGGYKVVATTAGKPNR